MDENISTVDAGQEVNVEPQQIEQVSTEPVNAGTDITTPSANKPVQSAEDNARFAAIRREAEQKARDKARDETISELYGEQGIHTYADYKKAVEEAKKQAEIERLVNERGIPEEYAQKLIKVDEIERQLNEEKQSKAEQERKHREFDEFFNLYRELNGTDFNPSTDQIPPEVWQMTKQGKTLADAYAREHTKQLKAKIAEYEKKIAAQETNDKNASSSPGSVTGNGSTKGDYISFDTFEANKHDQRWVISNLEKINKSRAKW